MRSGTEPAPSAEVVNMAEGWVEAALRIWVKSADYAPVRADYYLRARQEVDLGAPERAAERSDAQGANCSIKLLWVNR